MANRFLLFDVSSDLFHIPSAVNVEADIPNQSSLKIRRRHLLMRRLYQGYSCVFQTA